MTDAGGEHRAPDQGLLQRLNLSEPVRLRLYTITAAVVALLVLYRVLEPGAVPVWLAVAAALLGIGATESTRAAVPSPLTARQAAIDAVELATVQPMHPFTAAGIALERNSIPQP